MEGNRFGSPERSNMQTSLAQPRWALSVPEGHAKFRIVCFVNQVGDVIGKRGSVIKEIIKSTESKIQVEEGRIGSPERVITVIAPADSTSWVKLVVKNGGNWKKEEQEVEEVKVSKAQAALIRVFEVVNDRFWSGEASCRLLIEPSHVGVMKGEGGKMMKRKCQESGCKAEIFTANLPICADPDDAMVEIKGNVMAVKKALVSVSSHLQAWQQSAKTMFGTKPIEPVETNSHDYRLRKDDVLSHRTSLGSHYDALRKTRDVFPRVPLYRSRDVFQGDVREVDDPRDSFHRWNGENPMPSDKGKGPEQNVFTGFQNISLQNNNYNFILGESSNKEGRKSSDLNNNLNINIGSLSLGGSHLSAASSRAPPSTPSWFSQPVHCSTPVDADSYTRPEDPFRCPTRGYSPNFGRPSTTNAHDSFQPGAPRGAYDGSGGLSSRMSDPGLGSGLVTNITVEIRVPESAVRHLCREEEDGGSDCLLCMRQGSGARVIVREPHLGIIAISGTRDQIQTAQITLAEFIRVYS